MLNANLAYLLARLAQMAIHVTPVKKTDSHFHHSVLAQKDPLMLVMVNAKNVTKSARLAKINQLTVLFVLMEERIILQNAHAQTPTLKLTESVNHVLTNVSNVKEPQIIAQFVIMIENLNHLRVHAKMENLKMQKENVKIVIQNV